MLFPSDGERALRTLQQRYLPEAIGILEPARAPHFLPDPKTTLTPGFEFLIPSL